MKTRSIALAVLSIAILTTTIVDAQNLRSLKEDDTANNRILQSGGGNADYNFADENVDADENTSSTGRYIVRFKNDSSSYIQRMETASLSTSVSMDISSASRNNPGFGSFLPQDYAEVMNLDEKEAEDWEQREDVEFVELDSKVFLYAEEVPYGINKVKALSVLDEDVSNRKVCIIDTGFDIDHPDLASNPSVVTGYEGPFSAGPWDIDNNGHGTHVAGTIAAIGGNGEGVVGVNRNGELKLHIVRVFGRRGTWAWKSTLVSAMEACVDAGSNIISMSLGGPVSSRLEEEALKRMYEEDNVLVVAAAGNAGNTRYSYPASYSSVVSVAATDKDNKLASFSQRNDQVDIAAPGVDVLSTKAGGGYIAYSGTSMACPHVSGVAALIWSMYPTKTAREIRAVLEASAEDLGPLGRDDSYGHGLIRADFAAQFLDSNFTLSPTTAPTPEPPCFDRQGWENSRGRDCDWHASVGFRCSLWGNFFEKNGYTANEACCVCGGGVKIPITGSPTGSPIGTPLISPTINPSTEKSVSPTVRNTSEVTESPTVKTGSPTVRNTGEVTGSPTVTGSESPTQSPMGEPTSGAPTVCGDFPLGWTDSTGDGCAWYEGFPSFRCRVYGGSYANNGYTANDVCCACGGGGGGSSNTDSPTPSPSPGVCFDDPDNWHQRLSTNFDCEWFASRQNRCNLFGSFAGTDGKNANEACCVCGGGTSK